MSAIEKALDLLVDSPILPEQQINAERLWRGQNWPTRKTEAWKYTSLKALSDGSYFQHPQHDNSVVNSSIFEIPGLDAIRLVFVDGKFSEIFSLIPDDLTNISIIRFDQADEAHKQRIIKHLDKIASRHNHFFTALNTASVRQGVLVEIAENAVIDRPVHIVNFALSRSRASVSARVLWLQGKNSQASLIEQFVGNVNAEVFTYGVTELFVSENATCDHYRLNLDESACLHVGGVYSELERSSRLSSFYLSLGAKLQRVDVVTEFAGEGAEAINNGVYLPRNNDVVDFHTCIEHKVPHCTSNEIFRGIIGDSARAVFNGRIHIYKDAQKTLAQLSNKNLLISDKAEVNTKPELEIYADDVQCAHGATVAEIDKAALHYLRTRGISEVEARVMLSFGFINELVECLQNEAVGNYLKPLIARRFAKTAHLAQHIALGAKGQSVI